LSPLRKACKTYIYQGRVPHWEVSRGRRGNAGGAEKLLKSHSRREPQGKILSRRVGQKEKRILLMLGRKKKTTMEERLGGLF